MDQRQADAALQDAAIRPMAEGTIPYIKELVERCLDADIPAAAGRAPGAGKG